MDGLKTGFTKTAGYCLTATASKNNFRLISVVMGEDTSENRSSDTVKMLNYGFNTFKINIIKTKGESLGKVRVEKGKQDKANIVLLPVYIWWHVCSHFSLHTHRIRCTWLLG